MGSAALRWPRCESPGGRNSSAQPAAGKDQPDYALGMAPRELEDGSAPGRERDHDGTIDAEMVERQRVGVRLIGGRGIFGSVEPK
jgi:hypothetical protein